MTFNPDGTAQQLPEHYVPGAYRDWGVEIYDWQTQCSSNADEAQVGPSKGDGMHAQPPTRGAAAQAARLLTCTSACAHAPSYSPCACLMETHAPTASTTCTAQFRSLLRRLMPTVGCEADAVAFTEGTGDTWSSQQQLPVLGDGSYSAGGSGT